MENSDACTGVAVMTDEDNKNMYPVYCPRCGIKILCEGAAELVEHERSQVHLQKILPKIRKEEEGTSSNNCNVSLKFWKVNDVFDFENMGQTRAVAVNEDDDIEYTASDAASEVVYVTGDCEKEVVGIRWSSKEPYYVSSSLVIYEKPDNAPEDGALPAGMSIDYLRSLISTQQEAEESSKNE